MCNEKNTTRNNTHEKDYRFLDYRLNQLETTLKTGQEKIEQEQKQNYNELLKILQQLQEGNSTQNQTLAELNTRIKSVEQKMPNIDALEKTTTSHAKQIENLERRLDTYKQITTGIGIALIGTIITLFFNIITKVL